MAAVLMWINGLFASPVGLAVRLDLRRFHFNFPIFSLLLSNWNTEDSYSGDTSMPLRCLRQSNEYSLLVLQMQKVEWYQECMQ